MPVFQVAHIGQFAMNFSERAVPAGALRAFVPVHISRASSRGDKIRGRQS
jgi:hypothetical protein